MITVQCLSEVTCVHAASMYFVDILTHMIIKHHNNTVLSKIQYKNWLTYLWSISSNSDSVIVPDLDSTSCSLRKKKHTELFINFINCM